MISRFSFTIFVAGLVLACVPANAQAQADQTILMQDLVVGIGTYSYFPFEVPAGVNRVAVKITKDSDQTKLGAGLFDWRGAGFQSPGFRGIYGEEISEFYIAADSASRAFVAGPILPGTWTVVVPVFRAPTPTNVTVAVTLSFGEQLPTPPLQAPVTFIHAGAGWYAGDLHDHTTFSSDAFSSGTALDPVAFAHQAKAIGLDWVALTDHNVTAQNERLADAAPPGFLLLAGEETTNWFHGHSTSIGMTPGDYFDWRWRPLGTPIDPAHEGRVIDYLNLARQRGVYTAAAHPFGATLAWQCFTDSENDPTALPDGFEVWNGPFQPDDQATINKWDEELTRGRKIWANGGSDVHGLADPATDIGFPTTVVYADALSRDAIVAALKAGRSYVTTGPRGPGLFITATGPQDQQQMVGGTIYGAAIDQAHVTVLVRGGTGLRLLVYRNGVQFSETALTTDPQTVSSDQPIGAGGYVRAELRDAPAAEGDMRALTNPIFLALGAAPSPTPAPTPSPTASPSPSPSTTPTDVELLNISGRAVVEAGDHASIAGFIVRNTSARRVLVRGIGPSIQANGSAMPGTLQDPTLELHESDGTVLANDDWRDSQAEQIQQTGLAPSDDRESAIVTSLPSGTHTALLRGKDGASGIGLVEIYDLDSPNPGEPGNLSVRANVLTGDDVLIDGLIVRGGNPKRILLRAIGPSLTANGVPDALQDPALELHDSNGTLLAENDNWREAPNASEIEQTGLAPTNDRESAILLPLPQGGYTSVVRGTNGSTGIALAEVYRLD